MSKTATIVRRLTQQRWLLVATPAADTDLAEDMAHAWNCAPQTFRTRRGAHRAARFYERELRMPVEFWVRRTDEVES